MHCTETAAFEASAALDAYEEQLLTSRVMGASPHRLALMQTKLRRACACCVLLPQLSAASIALLLAHHQLLAELARPAGGTSEERGSTTVKAVEQCVANLQRGCRHLFLAPHLH